MIWLLVFGDTQLTATAREYGLTIATRNFRHFPFCRIEDPFELRDPTIEPAE
jgi:predicted nucleic acid-binding protein